MATAGTIPAAAPTPPAPLNPAQDRNTALDITAIAKPTNMMARLSTMPGVRDPVVSMNRQTNWDRTVNREALMAQVIGMISNPMCGHCQRGYMVFDTCITVLGEIGGSCTNCHYNGLGSRCSFRQGQVTRRNTTGGDSNDGDGGGGTNTGKMGNIGNMGNTGGKGDEGSGRGKKRAGDDDDRKMKKKQKGFFRSMAGRKAGRKTQKAFERASKACEEAAERTRKAFKKASMAWEEAADLLAVYLDDLSSDSDSD